MKKRMHVGEQMKKKEELHDVSLKNREMSDAKHEMSTVMQRVVFAVGPLECKSASFSSLSEISEGVMERQKREQRGQSSERK